MGKTAQAVASGSRQNYHSMKDLKPPLRNNLLQLRETLGLSMVAVAKEIGCSWATVQRAELGGAINLKLALRLAQFYEKDMSEIWPAPRGD